jgi:excisionase family DNA binding protein
MPAAAMAVVVEAEPGTKANPMLSLRTVAKRLEVSVKTVRRMRERGRFPGAKLVEGQVRVPEQDVLAYLRAVGS